MATTEISATDIGARLVTLMEPMDASELLDALALVQGRGFLCSTEF